MAKDWIDANDQRVRNQSDDLSKWWTVFNDPVLDSLICDAYGQNLTLRAAGMRVLQVAGPGRDRHGQLVAADADGDRELQLERRSAGMPPTTS